MRIINGSNYDATVNCANAGANPLFESGMMLVPTSALYQTLIYMGYTAGTSYSYMTFKPVGSGYINTDTNTTYSLNTGTGNTVTLTGSNGTSYTRTINNVATASSADQVY